MSDRPNNIEPEEGTLGEFQFNLEFHEVANLFPMMKKKELRELADNIVQEGLQDRITLFEGKILDGRNRYRACEIAGIAPEFVEFKGKNPWEWIWSENAERRSITKEQKALIWLKKNERSGEWEAKQKLIEEEANQKRSEAATQRSRKKDGTLASSGSTTCATTGSRKNHEVGQEARAKASKTNRGAIARAEVLRKERPDLAQEVMMGRMKMAAALRQAKKEKILEQIDNEEIPLPTGRFRTIVADPPWPYTNRATDDTHRGRNPYADMSLEEIEALPVGDRAHDDSILLLWTTASFLHQAFHCLNAWGFTYKTALVWYKVNIGLGDWLRNVNEFCLLAVRGKPVVNLTNQSTHIEEKRRQHSRKPKAFFRLVEELCPGPRLEMFAREKREGWSSWGAEVDKFDDKEAV